MMRLFSVIALIVGASLPTVNGFAAWLVDRELGCMTYLEKDEIIMNFEVLEAPDAKTKGVELQLLRDGKVLEEPVQYTEGETLQVQLSTPSALEYADVQYVLEIVSGDGAQFVGARVGCDGKRTSGPKKSSIADLKVGSSATIQLIAGWATGHEAVSLTPEVTLHKQGESKPSDGTAVTSDGNEPRKIMIKELEEHAMDLEGPMPHSEEEMAQLEAQELAEAAAAARTRQHKVRRRGGFAALVTKVARIPHEYHHNDEFGGGSSFSLLHFAYACAFAIFAVIGILYSSGSAPLQEKDL